MNELPRAHSTLIEPGIQKRVSPRAAMFEEKFRFRIHYVIKFTKNQPDIQQIERGRERMNADKEKYAKTHVLFLKQNEIPVPFNSVR